MLHRILLQASRTLLAIALAAVAVFAQDLVEKAQAATAAAAPNSVAWVRCRASEGCALMRADMAKADAALTDAADVAGRIGARAEQVIALASLARVRAKTTGRAAARELLERASGLLTADSPKRCVATVEFSYAFTHFVYDEIPDCMARWRSALDAADEAKDVGMRAYCELLAHNVLSPAEDPLPDLDRIDRLFQEAHDEGGRLDVAMLRANAKRQLGDLTVPDQVRAVLARAKELGDRSMESYATFVTAFLSARESDSKDAALYDRAVELARELGDVEVLCLALQGRCDFLAATGRLTEARAQIEEVIGDYRRIGMRAREYTALQLALRLASAARDTARSQACAERMSELERDLAAGSNAIDRARYWSLYSQMRSDFRQAQREHEKELALLDGRLNRTTWISVAILCLVGCGASMLLFRAKRRLERANARLCDEVAATARAQQESEALQESLRQLDRLDSIGVLAGGFAHDFNNILLAVQGNAQLALEEPETPVEVQRSLQEIVTASRRATNLCRDILAYSRAGRSEFQDCEIRPLVEGLLPIARAGLGAGVVLEFVPGGDGLCVRADGAKLEQVFLNMLVNAGEAVADRGHIRVQIGHAVLGGAPPSGHWFGDFPSTPREFVTVTISDDGHGMDAETVRRIFDPFFSTRFPGRGMGLAASYGNVRRHDGLVEVLSEVGRGSRFIVYLPRIRSAVPAPTLEPTVVLPAAPQPAAAVGAVVVPAATVLVVDDEAAVREVARRLLLRSGFQVQVAASGREALAKIAAEAADATIALIDFTMPEMDGAAVATALRARRPDLAIVLTSGHDEAAMRGLPANATFLAKPYGQAELMAAIRGAQGLAISDPGRPVRS